MAIPKNVFLGLIYKFQFVDLFRETDPIQTAA